MDSGTVFTRFKVITSIGDRFGISTFSRSIRVLPESDRPKLFSAAVIQVGLGFIDLIAVAAIGFLGALSISGIQSLKPDAQSQEILKLIGLGSVSFQAQVAILGVVCSVLLIARVLISIAATRKLLFFLSRRGASLTDTLISKLFSQSLMEVQSQPSQQLIYSTTIGVSSIVLGVIGSTFSLLADFALLLILLVGLFIVDPIIAMSSMMFFGCVSLLLYRSMNLKVHKLGVLNSEFTVSTNEKILHSLNSFREIVVGNRREYFGRQIGKLRYGHADVLAELQFLPNVGKYVIESSVVIGALMIAGIQFWLQDAQDAFATLAVFLAAGTRIAPAVLRIQQNALQLRNSVATSIPTLNLIESLQQIKVNSAVFKPVDLDHFGFTSSVVIKSASLTYPKSEKPTLYDVDLSISEGSLVALVGPSGAGKTSLVDVMLGVLLPQSGSVEISGKSPLLAFATWPGAVAYVPQNVVLGAGTIRENIVFGFTDIVDSELRIWESLEIANLADQVRMLPAGLDTLVGDGGLSLSGGQKQRLGIARALYTRPKLLVLDEATSALDGQTEESISQAIHQLKGSITVVVIAHRLTTVRNADHVVYLDHGKIRAQGDLEFVRATVSDFDEQAKLMGL